MVVKCFNEAVYIASPFVNVSSICSQLRQICSERSQAPLQEPFGSDFMFDAGLASDSAFRAFARPATPVVFLRLAGVTSDAGWPPLSSSSTPVEAESHFSFPLLLAPTVVPQIALKHPSSSSLSFALAGAGATFKSKRGSRSSPSPVARSLTLIFWRFNAVFHAPFTSSAVLFSEFATSPVNSAPAVDTE